MLNFTIFIPIIPFIFLKKLTLISFLLLFLISQIGYHIFYTITLHQVREEAQQRILASSPDSFYDKVCFEENSSAITWKEAGAEFCLNNKMYDVAKIKKENGKTILYCLNDKKEEDVVNEFLNSVKSATENTSNSKHQLVVKLHIPDLIVTKNVIKNDFAVQDDKEKYFDIAPAIVSAYKKITTPPPEFGI